MLNNCLEQLLAEYTPLVFKRALFKGGKRLRLLVITDSSLANRAGKYAQGGLLVFLCEDLGKVIREMCILIHFLSRKSRRVGTSSKHYETLALTVGGERGMMQQEVIF